MSQVSLYTLESVVSSGRAFLSKSQAPQRQTQIIYDNQQVGLRVEIFAGKGFQSHFHSLPRQIHESQRPQKDRLSAFPAEVEEATKFRNRPLGYQRNPFELRNLLGHTIQKKKPKVVPRRHILWARGA